MSGIKRMIRKTILNLILIVALIWIISISFGITFVVKPEIENKSEINYEIGDTIDVLKDLDILKGKCCSYLIINRDDFENLYPDIPKTQCLKLDNQELLEQMRKDWKMVYTGGDMATVTSSIIFVQEDIVIFESGIILDRDCEGLQSRDFGHIRPVKKGSMIKYLKQYRKIYSPIVFI